MYTFNRLNEDEKDKINGIIDDSLNSFYVGNKRYDLLIHNVLNDDRKMGYVFSNSNKISFYQDTNNGFKVNNMVLNEFGKIIGCDVLGDKMYISNPDSNKVIVLIKGDNNDFIKEYTLEFVKVLGEENFYAVQYSVVDYQNSKFYSYFFRQSRITDKNSKRDIIVPTRLNEPISYCYQKELGSKKFYGFKKIDIDYYNDPVLVYFLGVLNESKTISDFIYNWNYFQNHQLIKYSKTFVNKYGIIVESYPFVKIINENNYYSIINSFDEKFNIPDYLLDFYNGNLNEFNNLQNIVTEYQKSLKLHK